MATRVLYWRFGLFLVVGMVCVLLVLSLFASKTLGQQTVDYETYFDESVGGLGTGAPVRIRGITIGRVARIGLAPDRRHVDVTCSLVVKNLQRLGLATGHEHEFMLEPDMRTQLALSGLTGPQAVSIDFFDPATHPPPVLPFPVPEHTIPSTPSTLDSLGNALTVALAQLPDLLSKASRLLGEGGALVSQLGGAHIGDRADETLRSVAEVTDAMRRVIDKVGRERLPEQLGQAVGSLVAALSQVDQLLANLQGNEGLLTSARRASDSVDLAARGSRDVGRRLDLTLQEVRRSAAAVRRLSESIDRNPEMFLKGRPSGGP
jgi:ABC-type transporter Mla subunit MlaD